MSDMPTKSELLADERLDSYRADDLWNAVTSVLQHVRGDRRLTGHVSALEEIRAQVEADIDEHDADALAYAAMQAEGG